MATPDQGRERTWRFRLDDMTVLEASTEPPATDTRVKLIGALVVALTLLAVVFAAGAAAEGAPSIGSDKADYAPGEAVALSGSGWVAGETVHVVVDDDQSDPWTYEADLTAADDGSVSDALTLPEVAGTYTVTATAPSGTASASFTATAPPPPLPPPPPPLAGPSISSDKSEYAPGDAVALTGSGWVAAEAVHIVVDDDQDDPWSHEADVTAADDGTISDSFDLPELTGTFTVSATAPSGSADASFTVTAQPPAPPPTTDPTLSSDKDAYSPGETVTLSGADWTAGDSVHIAVDDDKGDAWEHSADVPVADDGSLTDSFDLPSGLAATFTATATDSANRSAEATVTASFASASVPYLVRFASGTSTDTQAQILAAAGAESQSYIRALRIHGVLLPGGGSLQASLDKLRSYSAVISLEPDREREAGSTPNDSNYGDQWSLPQIGWENAFGTVSPGGSARVAILDTGIDGSHPDLDGNVVAGTSILDGSNGLSDPNGHGTAMAGIVAAETDNGVGVAGIGYAGVQVMPVVVLGADGTGQDSDIIEGVVYAAENGADVILMAFSNPGYSEMLQAAIDYAWENGAVLVAATGNDGSSSVTFPAGDRGVIGVSNTDQSDALNGSSNYGQAVFLGAPGTGIATTAEGGGYTSITGTSAAAAEVAGAAALISANSGASNGVIVSRLAKNAEPAGTQEQTGNGRLNVDRAIADESTDSIQPSGADPVGSGGPIVGPYVAAARNVSIDANVSVNEGNSGTTTMTFNLSSSGNGTGTVDYTTAPSGANPATEGTGTCDPGEDYIDSSGTLSFSGTQTTNTISVTLCGDATFEPNETFTVTISNPTPSGGTGVNVQTGSRTGTILNDDAANSPPAGTDTTITINEDGSYTFAAADFGFTDPNAGDTMSAVRIDMLSLAAGSTLKLSGVNVTAAQVIPTAQISNLVFAPAPNANGSPYASFTFSVRDTNGPAFDPTPKTMTINVTAVDDPPVAVNDSATVLEDALATSIPVLVNDTDIDGGPESIVSATDPANGTVVITGGGTGLTYEPDPNYCNNPPGTSPDTFMYTLSPGGSTATVSVKVTCVDDPAVVAFTGGETSRSEGESDTYTFSITDPDSSSFTYETGYPTCGTGGILVGTPAISSSGGSFECSFPDGPATPTVAVVVRDASSPSNEATRLVTVANIAPDVTAPADQTADEGTSKLFSLGSFTDPGDDDPWEVTVDWDDGTPDTVFTEGAAGPIAATHTFPDDGTFTVTVTVVEDNGTGASGSATFEATVANIAPTKPGKPATSDANPSNTGDFTLTWTASTDVPADTVEYTFEHKDADDAVYSTVTTGLLLTSYTFGSSNPSEAEGTWTYRVTANDEDGGVSDTSDVSDPIKVDTTDPNTPSVSADRPPDYAGGGGWYKDSVTVTFTHNGDPDLQDGSPGSGVHPASVPAPQAYTTSGSHTTTGTVKDFAENESASASLTVQVDTSNPTFGVCTGGPFILGSGMQPVSITAADIGESGVDAGASTLSGSVDTSTIGTKNVIFTAIDNVGHSTTKTCSYNVIFNFHGFFQPVDNNGVYNVVNSGRAIPVKFDLSGNQGLDIFAAGYPASTVIACNSSASTDVLEETLAAGNSSLSYSEGQPFGQYHYVWKTEKAWANTCRRLDVKFIDGTTRSAFFKFTR